jgi:hypothetical protein
MMLELKRDKKGKIDCGSQAFVKTQADDIIFSANTEQDGPCWFILHPGETKARELHALSFDKNGSRTEVSFGNALTKEELSHLTIGSGDADGYARNGVLSPLAPFSQREKDDIVGRLDRDEIDLLPLKERRVIDKAYRAPDGEHIVVTMDAAHPGIDSFRVYKGRPDAMRELAVKNVSVVKADGTLTIETEGGTLHDPAARRPSGADPATWNDAPMLRIPPGSIKFSASAEHAERETGPQNMPVASTIMGTMKKQELAPEAGPSSSASKIIQPPSAKV